MLRDGGRHPSHVRGVVREVPRLHASGWETGYADTKFWHLVYDATAPRCPTRSRSPRAPRGLGLCHRRSPPEPWARCRRYWTSELARCGATPGECRPMTRAHVTVAVSTQHPRAMTRSGCRRRRVSEPPVHRSGRDGRAARRARHRHTILDVAHRPAPSPIPPVPGGRPARAERGGPSRRHPAPRPAGSSRRSSTTGRAPSRVSTGCRSSGRAGSYPSTEPLPLSVDIHLDPTATDGPCASGTFPLRRRLAA